MILIEHWGKIGMDDPLCKSLHVAIEKEKYPLLSIKLFNQLK